jgi:transposase
MQGVRPSGSPERLEKRRRKAIALLRAGQTYQKVAAAVKSSVSSIVRWYQAFRRHGKKGLDAKPASGRPTRLTASQVATVERLLAAGAQKAGYATDLWTLRRVADLIEQRFDVHYGLTGARRLLLRRLHWTWQKPERRAIERDEKAIAKWKRKVWPNIKKRQAAAGSSGVPRRERLPAHPKRAKNVGPRRKDSRVAT